MAGKILSVLTPIGAAIAVFYLSLTSVTVMQLVGSTIPNGKSPPLAFDQILGTMGLALLGIGLIAGAFPIRLRSTPTVCLFVGSAITLAVAAFFIAFGNWMLCAEFQKIAVSASPDFSAFMASTENAKLPLQIGWASVLAGALLFVAGDFVGKRVAPFPTQSIATSLAVVAALLMLFLLLAAGGWRIVAVRSLEHHVANPQVRPDVMASMLMSVLLAGFVTAIAMAGGAVAVALLALSTKPTSEQPTTSSRNA